MNQHRWTCLATVVLTTVVGPIANVHANTVSQLSESGNYVPISPQSLPTIVPLVVTELNPDVGPAPVPQVSKLPIITVFNHKLRTPWRSKQHQRSQLTSPSAIAKLPIVTPVFSSNVYIAVPTNPIVTAVNPVAPLPLPIFAPVVKTPILMAPLATAATLGTTIDRLDATLLPQSAPIIGSSKDLQAKGLRQGPDLPSFESGVPAFGINSDRTQQIVVTAIAQVGQTIVAPESSIAIPVETPRQSTPLPKLPAAISPVTTSTQPAATTKPALDKIVTTQNGQASWYGIEGGTQTANGEKYNPAGLTAAHRTLPFGTKVRVTSLKTGKVVTVRINDRGPSSHRRMIDISAGAAEAIGIKNDGIGNVRMEVLEGEG